MCNVLFNWMILVALLTDISEAVDHSANQHLAQRSPIAIEQATQIADLYTGFSSLHRTGVAVVEVSTVKYQDTTTPFIRGIVNGKPSWLVEYVDLRFAADSNHGDADGSIWSARVWIDSASGQFLGAEIVPVASSGPLPPRESATTVEKNLTSEFERYHGVPTQVPSLSLRECLEKYLARGVADVLSSQKIEVKYVLYSIDYSPLPQSMISEGLSYHKMYEGERPIPAWVFCLYGARLSAVPGRDYRPLRVIGEWRIVFDAETGKSSPERYHEFDPTADEDKK